MLSLGEADGGRVMLPYDRLNQGSKTPVKPMLIGKSARVFGENVRNAIKAPKLTALFSDGGCKPTVQLENCRGVRSVGG